MRISTREAKRELRFKITCNCCMFARPSTVTVGILSPLITSTFSNECLKQGSIRSGLGSWIWFVFFFCRCFKKSSCFLQWMWDAKWNHHRVAHWFHRWIQLSQRNGEWKRVLFNCAFNCALVKEFWNCTWSGGSLDRGCWGLGFLSVLLLLPVFNQRYLFLPVLVVCFRDHNFTHCALAFATFCLLVPLKFTGKIDARLLGWWFHVFQCGKHKGDWLASHRRKWILILIDGAIVSFVFLALMQNETTRVTRPKIRRKF